MKNSSQFTSCWTLLVLVLAGYAPAVQGQDAPVAIGVEIAGDPIPGRQITARATIDIRDGSTLENIAWTQTGGVDASLGNVNARNLTLRLAPDWRYRQMLFHVLDEPPIGAEDLPPNVPPPAEEFPGGLASRWGVLGINPFALEETGLITLRLTVTTSSGTYTEDVEIHTELPWRPSAGIRNVPIGVPVLLNSKEQGSYDWQLTAPANSRASLPANGRFPEFTPDVEGIYTVRVTDRATGQPVEIVIYAGTWRGIIVDQNEDGRPVAEGLCTACHRSGFGPDEFTPWMETGHAEIFINNVNTNSHYSTNCFGCHGVGFDPEADNGGWDEAEDFQAFLASGMLSNPNPGNWTTTLEDYPATAQLANIQCENCHGPQSSRPHLDTLAHGWRSDVTGEPRVSLSSDVCAQCHGEPLRHARFQQWQLSAHANYELAIEEGGSGNCARCHTVNGFLKWLPILLGEEEGDPLASIRVTWNEDETHPQTCVACHDPHDVGTTTGIDTNARVRIAGRTPNLVAGFRVIGAGRAAICMTCHNSRRGLRNDGNYAETKLAGDATRAPHGSAQTDVLMGENAYMVNVGVRGRHSLLVDSCVTCHMEATPPPDVLSYNQGGTNHTFFASKDVCQECHTGITADSLQTVVQGVMDHLQDGIEDAFRALFAEQIAAGNRIDLDGTVITNVAQVGQIVFGETHGQQAIDVTLANGTNLGLVAVGDVAVLRQMPLAPLGLYEVAGDELIKAGWNWSLIHNDGSKGAHNPTWALSVLDAARDGLRLTGGPRAVLPPAL